MDDITLQLSEPVQQYSTTWLHRNLFCSPVDQYIQDRGLGVSSGFLCWVDSKYQRDRKTSEFTLLYLESFNILLAYCGTRETLDVESG
jgi:hypothetical protein